MIDREKFESNYAYFGKEVLIQIIDIFLTEYDERIAALAKYISERDFDKIRFAAHSLKGAIANFMASEPAALAGKLEEMAENKQSAELDEVFSGLAVATKAFYNELTEYRKDLQSGL